MRRGPGQIDTDPVMSHRDAPDRSGTKICHLAAYLSEGGQQIHRIGAHTAQRQERHAPAHGPAGQGYPEPGLALEKGHAGHIRQLDIHPRRQVPHFLPAKARAAHPQHATPMGIIELAHGRDRHRRPGLDSVVDIATRDVVAAVSATAALSAPADARPVPQPAVSPAATATITTHSRPRMTNSPFSPRTRAPPEYRLPQCRRTSMVSPQAMPERTPRAKPGALSCRGDRHGWPAGNAAEHRAPDYRRHADRDRVLRASLTVQARSRAFYLAAVTLVAAVECHARICRDVRHDQQLCDSGDHQSPPSPRQ